MNNITRICFFEILKYFTSRHIYFVIACVNKKINGDVVNFLCNLIVFDENKHLMQSNKMYLYSRIKTECFRFNNFDINKNMISFIERLNSTKKITFENCDFFWNNIRMPKSIDTLEVIRCKRINNKQIIKIIKNSSIENINLSFSGNFKESFLDRIFELDLKSLSLGFARINGNCFLENRYIEQLSKMSKIQNFKLSFAFFKESCDFKCLRNLRLREFSYMCGNITTTCIENILNPSLEKISLEGTKLTNSFLKVISESKNCVNISDISIIDVEGVTEECIEYLNKLKLKSLTIRNCFHFKNLKGLNIPTLTKLDVYNSFLSDNDLVSVLNNPLTKLNVCFNGITDNTLKRINDRKIKLDELYLAQTGVTLNGIIKFLSGMKMRKLLINSSLFNVDILMKKGVIQNEQAVKKY
jgi:hypothetical protein